MAAATTSGRPRRAGGPDAVTVTLLSVAGFLVIFAVLAWQMRSAPAATGPRVTVVRKVYETRVLETVVGGPRGGAAVTQSVSSSGSSSAGPVATAAPATTRAS